MMKALLCLFLLVFMVPAAQNGSCQYGVLDLQKVQKNPERPIRISGTVPLYWKSFVTADEVKANRKPDGMLVIPGDWNGTKITGGTVPGIGWGSIAIYVSPPKKPTRLALKIPSVRTAYSLYLDDRKIAGAGVPGKSAEQASPAYQPMTITLPLKTEPFYLIFHISNFSSSSGGPRQPIYIGESSAVQHLQQRINSYEIFAFGVLFFFILMQISNYRFNKGLSEHHVILPLIGFSIAVLIRAGLTGERIFYFLFPLIPAELLIRLEYISLFSAGIFFHLYIHGLYIQKSSRAVRTLVIYAGSAFILTALLTPVKFSSGFIILFQVVIFLVMFYQIYLAYSSRSTRSTETTIHIITILVLFTAAVHDIRSSYGTASLLSLTPLANIFVVFAQTMLLTREQARIYRDRVHMEQDLAQINAALRRFVPEQFFSLLNTVPEKVHVGMKQECRLSIMSADIRGFTALSERMSPEMNYLFINRFIAAVTPVITAHKGFINNFIGDAFIAVFPGSPEDAVRAALQIQHVMENGDHFSSFMLKETVQLGIGIDFGIVTAGIQGSDIRMENTLLGEAASASARLETLTRHTGAKILISENLRQSLSPELTEGRPLGFDTDSPTKLKLCELFCDTDSSDTKRKRRTLETVNRSAGLIEAGLFSEALALLEQVPAEITRYDIGIEYLKMQCRRGMIQC